MCEETVGTLKAILSLRNHYKREMRRRTIRQHGHKSSHEPAKRPFLLIQMASHGRSREVKSIPSCQPQREMLDDSTDPRMSLHALLIKQYTCRRIIARTRAGACYPKEKQLPRHKEGQKPSEVRLGRSAYAATLDLPRGWPTNARGWAEVCSQNLEHDECGDMTGSQEARLSPLMTAQQSRGTQSLRTSGA
jgi:hypothetical protein